MRIRKRKYNKARAKFFDCPVIDICNYSKKCWDEDWEHCSVYINIKKLFSGSE